MKLPIWPVIRNDDVLQIAGMTKHQLADMRGRTLFECFLEADKVFEKYNHECLLAINAEGIDVEHEWVEHLKKNKHRYVFELHGFRHVNYRNMPREHVKDELRTAIERINETFDVEVTTWYPPWGRKGEHLEGKAICEELGIKMYEQYGKVDARLWLKAPDKYSHVNFHYWNDKQVKTVEQILCHLHEQN